MRINRLITRLVLMACALGTIATAQSTPPDVLTGRTDTLLHSYLMRQAKALFAERNAAVEASLESAEALCKRRTKISNAYRDLIGDMPVHRTPLHPQTTARHAFDGYHVENVLYESRPNHHVSANLYIPDGEGPWPAILFVCGHSAVGKAAEAYQRAAILLAKNGFVVLVVDPISQGERYQLLDEQGVPLTRGGTVEHSFIYILSQLVGTSTVAFEAWDNLRGIDYLVSRSEVNPTRIGLTGNSGGGTQTTFLMSLDDRIDVAAPSCYIMTRERLFETIGPQDGCQHLPREGLLGIDHADYLTMFSPRPVMVLAAEQDFFEFKATRQAYKEISAVYEILGIPERTRFFSFDDTHGYSQPRREAMTQWMRNWFYDDDRIVVESDFSIADEADLLTTPTGQVGSSFEDERMVHQILEERASALQERRADFLQDASVEEIRNKVTELLGLRSQSAPPVVSERGTWTQNGHSVRSLVIRRPGDVPLPGHMYRPREPRIGQPAVLLVDSRGKAAVEERDGAIQGHLEAGRTVLAIDIRGFGETRDDPENNKYISGTQPEYRTAMIALHIGRPLPGQRVEDIMAAVDVLKSDGETADSPVLLHAFREAGPPAMHAAALDVRIDHTRVEEAIPGWLALFKQPNATGHLGTVVPRALKWYDLPDLQRLIAPRSFEAVAAIDAEGRPLSR